MVQFSAPPPAIRKFKESEFVAYVAAGTFTLSHDFGILVKGYSIIGRCTAADLGYSAGNQVFFGMADGDSANRGWAVRQTVSSAIVHFPYSEPYHVRRDTNVQATIDPAKWEFQLKVWA